MIGEFIQVYEDAISPEDCDAFIQALEAHPDATREITETWRRCTMVDFPHPFVPESDTLIERLRAILRDVLQQYKDSGRGFETAFTINFCTTMEKPNVIRYQPAGEEAPQHFHEHSDAWNVDSSTRQLSFILYLNDVEEGGETVFPRHDVSVRPKKGSVLVFPSSFLFTHLAKPPVSGSKYVIVTWLHFTGEGIRYAHMPL